MVGCDERVGTASTAAIAPAALDTAMTDRVTLEIKGAKLNVRGVLLLCACGFILYFLSFLGNWSIHAHMHACIDWVFYSTLPPWHSPGWWIPAERV